MEEMGVYGEALAYYLVAQKYAIVIEPPLRVRVPSRPRVLKRMRWTVSKLPNTPVATATN